MSQRADDAACLSIARPRHRRMVARRFDPLTRLKIIACARRGALRLRPLVLTALALSTLVLIAGNNDSALVPLLLLGTLAAGLEQAAAAPATTRGRRILRDRRPYLCQRLVVVPASRRRARIVARHHAPLVLHGLPPNRPRTRALDRREAFSGPELE